MKNRGKGNEWLIIKKKDATCTARLGHRRLRGERENGPTQEEIAGDLPAKKSSPKKKVMPGFIEPML